MTPAVRREFLKSNRVADPAQESSRQGVVSSRDSLEETAQARGRWPDSAMDARWARIWKPEDSWAKARLIIKGITDPDLLGVESHSPALTREGFMTVLQSVCSHGQMRSPIDGDMSEETLAGWYQKDKNVWKIWYEAIEEKEEERPQSKNDITVQCIDFCEVSTATVLAVLQRAPSDLRGGTFFLTTPACSGGNSLFPGKNPTLLLTNTSCNHVPGPSRCIHATTCVVHNRESGGTGAP